MEILKTPIDVNILKIQIGVEKDEAAHQVTGAVELDIENQSYFVDTVNAIFEEGARKVLVDMSNVTYIDSSGLWALFEGHKKATQKNSTMALMNVTKDVKRVLDITKMSSKLSIFENEESAVNSLK